MRLILAAILYSGCPAAMASGGDHVTLRTLEGRDTSIKASDLRFPERLHDPALSGGGAFDWSNVDYIEFDDRPRAAAVGTWLLSTHRGGVMPVEIVGGDAKTIHARHASLGGIQIPIESVVTLRRRLDTDATFWDRSKTGEAKDDAAGGFEEDSVQLTNGDTVAGAVSQFSSEGLTLFDGDSDRAYAWRVVRRIEMASTGERKARPDANDPALTAMIFLTDGTRIFARSFRIQGSIIKLHSDEMRLDAGDEARRGGDSQAMLSIPMEKIRRIEILGGLREWLSSLSPSSYEVTPYFDIHWPYQLDRNVLGGRLALRGREYDRGIGLHSACRIAWKFDGRYERFRCTLGIDDSAGPLADAEVRILLDGRELARFEHLKHDDPPREVDVSIRPDVADSRRANRAAQSGGLLVIEVGFGDHGDTQDRVNIVNAALVGSSGRLGR